ncbi:hypothetical protein PSHT_04441 [Puccinia striiformis]|uniref:Uncharacterized protein n=1 Tax=Puccinia striiformis TaxID=27350 RepID=A0A2S4WD56_9BASI|nr:hypothetical protein PSHT_04441 [Puccinia striiformis]
MFYKPGCFIAVLTLAVPSNNSSFTPTETITASPTPALRLLRKEGNHGKSFILAPATGAATQRSKSRESNNIFSDLPALATVQDKDGNWWQCNYYEDGDNNRAAVYCTDCDDD